MTDAQTPVPPPAARPRKRRLLGCFIKGPIGCLAFCLGGLAALVLLLPTLAEWLVVEYGPPIFHETYQGSLELDSASLSWFNEQELEGLRLLDPEGQVVARASASAPSLLSLFDSGFQHLAPVRIELEADLVADEAGITNLQRALALRTDIKQSEFDFKQPDSSDDGRLWPSELEARAELVVERLSWSDERTRSLGKPFAIQDLAATLSVQPEQPLRLVAKGVIAGERRGVIDLSATVHHPARASLQPLIDLDLRLDGLATGLVDALAQQGGLLEEALGDHFDLSASARSASAEGGPVTLKLHAPKAEIALAATLRPAELSMKPGEELSAAFDCAPGLLQKLMGEECMTRLGLARTSAGRLSLTARNLYLPFGRLLPGAVAPAGLEPFLLGCKADLEGRMGSFELRPASSKRVAIEDVSCKGSLGPAQGALQASVRLEARLDGKPAHVALEVSNALAGLALSRAEAFPELTIQLKSSPLPTESLQRLSAIVSLPVTPEDPGTIAVVDGKRVLTVSVADMNSWRQENAVWRDWNSVFGPEIALTATLHAKRLVPDGPIAASATVKTQARSALDAELNVQAGGNPRNEPFGFDYAKGAMHVRGAKLYAVHFVPARYADYVDLLAPEMDLDFDLASLCSSERKLSAKLSSGETQIELAGSLSSERLRVQGEQRVLLKLRRAPLPDLAGALPPGAKLVVGGPVLLEARELDLPLGDALADIDKLLGSTRGKLHAELGFASYEDPSTNGPLELRELACDAMLAPAGGKTPFQFDVRAKLRPAKQAERDLAVQASVTDLGLALAAARGKGAQGLRATARAQGLPVAPLGALLGSTGLAVSLGDLIDFDLDASLAPPAASGRGDAFDLLARVSSPASAGAREPFEITGKLSDLQAVLASLKSKSGQMLPLPPALSFELGARGPVEWLEALSGPGQLRPLLGDSVDVHLRADLERPDPAQPLRCLGTLRAGGGAPLEGDFKLAYAENTSAADSALPFRLLKLELDARGVVPLAQRLAPASVAPYLGLLGDELRLTADVDHQSDEHTPFTLRLDSGPTHLSAAGELGPTRLRLKGQGLSLKVGALPAAALQALAANLPVGTQLEMSGALELTGTDIDLPVGDSILKPADVLPLANGTFELKLGGIQYADAQLTLQGQALRIENPFLKAQLESGKPLRASLDAALAGASQGTLVASLWLKDPALLGQAPDGSLPPVDIDARITGLSTAIVDAWAGRKGLLVDILGVRLDLDLKARGLTRTSGTLEALLVSPQSRATLTGQMGEGLLFSVEEQKTDLAFALTPLASKRVVGSLVPMLVAVRSTDASQRAALTLSHFTLPLDGDLSKLSGTATLDLGTVDFSLLPGIAELFAPGLARKAQRLGPYLLSIQKGVVGYADLPIEIGGRLMKFSGSCDLGKSEFKLRLDVPLAALGKGVSDLLEKNRKYLSADLAVPLEITGAWTSPKIGLGKDFLKNVVEEAAKKAVLGGLLDGLGKKKKKEE